MIGNISGFTGIIISIFLLVLFAVGLWYSKKHSFKAGIYFFLIMIIHRMYSLVATPIIGKLIDTLIARNAELPLGMSVGELIALLSLIPKIMELAAFIILIAGLRCLWDSRKSA